MLFHLLIVGHKAITMRQACLASTSNNKRTVPTAIFSAYGCHTLNLCGNDAAECIPVAITSEPYKQYTPYSVEATRGGKYWQSGLVVCFMACLVPNG